MRPKKPKPRKLHEDSFFETLPYHGIPEPVREMRFFPGRQWRFDFAWPESKIAAEIEGGVWSGGRHTRGSGFVGDCRKYSKATSLGWRIFRFTPEMLKDGTAYTDLRLALECTQDCPSKKTAAWSQIQLIYDHERLCSFEATVKKLRHMMIAGPPPVLPTKIKLKPRGPVSIQAQLTKKSLHECLARLFFILYEMSKK